ncbi:MAG TPA: FMN-binding protein [Rhodoglobus sp.]|nr:FMN-binding protein [Rhodoglobus sp.]HPU03382.1 FMN-binding protein [Rhodoglobus sp.]HQI65802.1 FMN-binding protein [Rhodoglobus sp.]
MRTRAVLGSIFASLGVLVIGWQAGNAAVMSATTATSTTTPTTTTSGGNSGTSSSGTSNGSNTTTSTGTTTAAPVAPTTGATDGTYAGSTVNTRFGPVQVQVTISGGAITDVTALQLTNTDGRSVQISNYASPILAQEVLSSQSAQVSNVGGATYTSQAYLQSLQSALDQAGF